MPVFEKCTRNIQPGKLIFCASVSNGVRALNAEQVNEQIVSVYSIFFYNMTRNFFSPSNKTKKKSNALYRDRPSHSLSRKQRKCCAMPKLSNKIAKCSISIRAFEIFFNASTGRECLQSA